MLKDTIISAFNYDGTLLKWLKKVQEALENASASEFRVNKKGNATISFSIVFANGDTLESGDIILQQGESVTGATIRQGHLILTLSNGDELDAGDLGAVTGFSINDSQHLIVTYQNGTTQDLGAIFTGNVNINGNFTANSIIENMSGYAWQAEQQPQGVTFESVYIGCVKNGNKLTLVVSGYITRSTSSSYVALGAFNIPTAVGIKLYSVLLPNETDSALDIKEIKGAYSLGTLSNPFIAMTLKLSNNRLRVALNNISTLTENTKYYFRYEVTLLLSDNLN